MEENNYPFPPKPESPKFSTGWRELVFGLCILAGTLLLVNSVLWGGFYLGFAIAAGLCILASTGYLLLRGFRPDRYSAALLVLSLGIAAGFGYSTDSFVKLVLLGLLAVSVNLGLCRLAGQALRGPGHLGSLLDAPRALFSFGFGKVTPAVAGIRSAVRRTGTGQKTLAVLAGLGITVPVLAVVISLLVQADAAFEGLLQQLPRIDLGQLIITLLWGGGLGLWLYTRGVGLGCCPPEPPRGQTAKKKISSLTVNTLLLSVCLVYLVYLVSQTAYLTGGFSRLLPPEFTLAQYARRGFFEMAWLCGINLGLIGISSAVVQGRPLLTRLLCLFLGLVTLFLVATACGKMLLYIDAYGLTRLRVLTMCIMLWLGLTTLLVTLHLFIPRLGYMQTAALAALVMGLTLFWADVDSQVARYNVDAYLSGSLQSVDVDYLGSLGDGAVPQLQRLEQEAPEESVAQLAWEQLRFQASVRDWCEDFRGTSVIRSRAEGILECYLPEDASPTHTDS